MDRPDNRLIIGKTGSGKTVKALKLIADAPRVVIFDTLGQDYSDGVVFYDLAALKAFWLSGEPKIYQRRFRLIYRPTNEIEEFDEVCDLAYKCGDLTLVAEELDLFCPPRQLTPGIRHILKRGRHADITFIGITQRPYGIDRTVTAMCNEVYVFKTDEPRDIKYLCERLGEGIAGKIAALQEYEYVLQKDHSSEFVVGKDHL
jgi:hypothetical protein